MGRSIFGADVSTNGSVALFLQPVRSPDGHHEDQSSPVVTVIVFYHVVPVLDGHKIPNPQTKDERMRVAEDAHWPNDAFVAGLPQIHSCNAPADNTAM